MLAELAFYSSILGSTLVILPTFKFVGRILTDGRKLENLESGRKSLLNFESIHRTDPEFEDILGVIVNRNDEILRTLVILGIYPALFGGWGGVGGKVYALDRKQAGADNPFDAYEEEDPELIDSILIVDEWICEEIEHLRNRPKQRVRALGFVLIMISVIIQAYLLSTQGRVLVSW